MREDHSVQPNTQNPNFPNQSKFHVFPAFTNFSTFYMLCYSDSIGFVLNHPDSFLGFYFTKHSSPIPNKANETKRGTKTKIERGEERMPLIWNDSLSTLHSLGHPSGTIALIHRQDTATEHFLATSLPLVSP